MSKKSDVSHLTLAVLSFPTGGAKGGVFFSERYGALSGLNNVNLDFLPVQNIEDSDIVIAGIGAVPVGKSSVFRTFLFFTKLSIILPFTKIIYLFRGSPQRPALEVTNQWHRIAHIGNRRIQYPPAALQRRRRSIRAWYGQRQGRSKPINGVAWLASIAFVSFEQRNF